MRQSFVLLRYSPGSVLDQGWGFEVLVVQEGGQLAVYHRSDWRKGLSDEAHYYLSDLIAYWRQAPLDDIPAILEELGQLSVGPLQAIESGALDGDRHITLRTRVLAGLEV